MNFIKYILIGLFFFSCFSKPEPLPHIYKLNSPESLIEKAARDAWGDAITIKEKRQNKLRKVELTKQHDGGLLVKIEFLESFHYKPRKTLALHILQFFQYFSKNNGFSNINTFIFFPYTEFSDQNGNNEIAQAAKIVLKTEALKNIKWDNMVLIDMERIIDQNNKNHWFHPALRK